MTHTIYVDLETAGLSLQHPVIQLAAVAVDSSFKEVDHFETKLQFHEADADPEALALNHYTAAAWADAVPPANAAQLLSGWARPYLSLTMQSKRTGQPYQVGRLAGYNALTFDWPRLQRLYDREFCPFSYHVRDVLQLVLWAVDRRDTKPENLKLTTVAAWLGIPTDGAHDALADARIAVAVARVLIAEQEIQI